MNKEDLRTMSNDEICEKSNEIFEQFSNDLVYYNLYPSLDIFTKNVVEHIKEIIYENVTYDYKEYSDYADEFSVALKMPSGYHHYEHGEDVIADLFEDTPYQIGVKMDGGVYYLPIFCGNPEEKDNYCLSLKSLNESLHKIELTIEYNESLDFYEEIHDELPERPVEKFVEPDTDYVEFDILDIQEYDDGVLKYGFEPLQEQLETTKVDIDF